MVALVIPHAAFGVEFGVHVSIICVISVKYQRLDERFSRKLQSAQQQRPTIEQAHF